MHTNHYVVVILIFFFFSCNKKAEYDNADQRLKSIIKIQEIAKTNPDSFLVDLKRAEKLIAAGGVSDSIKGENDFMIGRRYARGRNLDTAAIYFQRAMDQVKTPITTIRRASYFNFAYNIYSRLGKYGDCLALSSRYQTLLDVDADYRWHSFSHYMAENVYKQNKDYENALKSNLKRVAILEKAGDTLDMIPALMSQAQSHYFLKNKSTAFAILDNLIKKEKYLDIEDNRKLFSDYAVYLSKEGDYHNSLKYNLKSLNYKKKLKTDNRKRLIATSYANIAEVYIELKNYKKAKKYIDSVTNMNLNVLSRRTQKEVLTHQMRLSVLDKSNLDDVLTNLNTIYDFQDKTYEEKYSNELVALTKANEKEKVILKEKQDADIKNLKLQSRIQFIFLAVGLLGIIGYLFFRQRKLGFERQQLQMQQRLLRSQMNPHFTSNTLYAIQNLVKDTPEVAGKYLTKFSRLLRLVLENSMSNYVQLEDELETLKKYLDLQQLRFESKFSYHFKLNNMEEGDLIFIPPMLIQPVVENSIEHGLMLTEKGVIKITLSKQKKFIECRIEDNGKGILENDNSTKQSASTQLIDDFLRKTTKSGLKIHNKSDIEPNTSGVIVTFLIPFKLTEDD